MYITKKIMKKILHTIKLSLCICEMLILADITWSCRKIRCLKVQRRLLKKSKAKQKLIFLNLGGFN